MLHEQISALQVAFDELKSKAEMLKQSESDTRARLVTAEEKCALLQEECDRLRSRYGDLRRDGEHEKFRQVKYLEQENLQLMLDLKAARKQLQTARSDLEDLSKHSVPLGSVDSVSPKSQEVSKSDGDKENAEVFRKTRPVKSTAKTNHRSTRAKARRIQDSNGQSMLGLGEAGVDDDNTGECRQS